MTRQAHILQELQELSPVVAAVPLCNVFTVPPHYFEWLPTQVLLATQHNPAMPAVPAGYFEQFASSVMDRIKAEDVETVTEETARLSPEIAAIGTENVFTVPKYYFEESRSALAANAGVAAETELISPLVAGIGRTNVFNVPQGYFAQFKVEIPAQSGEAKVIDMRGRLFSFKYAVAAALIGLISMSTLFMLHNNSQQTAAGVAVMAEASEMIQQNNVDETFNTLSDDAIVSFLESKGQDVDAALVASLTDENNLPDAMDYMLDDNTLNDMLKTVGVMN